MISEEQINDLIESNEQYSKAYFVWQMDEDNTDIKQFFIDEIEYDIDDRVLALMQHTGDMFYDCVKAIDTYEWLVLTDEEADERVEQYANDSLDNLLYGMDKNIKEYFNSEEYIKDYIGESDRGSVLALRDGCEYYEIVNEETYYLYNCS